MDVWEIYTFIQYRANKEQSGRSFTPDQFNLVLKAIDIEFLKWKYGLPEQYRPGAPFPQQAWELTQKITDDLRHLKVHLGGKYQPLLSIDQYGFANIPTDYIHYSSFRYDRYANKPDCQVTEEASVTVEVLKDADFDARVSSTLKAPSKEYPITRFQNDYLEFRPRDLRYVSLTYLRMPIPGFMATTINDNNDFVYDPTNSIQIEWPQDMHTDVANLIYDLLSDNLSSQQMKQSAEMRKTQGV